MIFTFPDARNSKKTETGLDSGRAYISSSTESTKTKRNKKITKTTLSALNVSMYQTQLCLNGQTKHNIYGDSNFNPRKNLVKKT